MTWMQFLIALADTLAWPTVLVVALIAMREPMAALIPLARRLRYKDLELEFGNDLQAVADRAEAAFPELRTDRKAALIAAARNLPNAAVLDAWQAVDDAATALIRARRGNVNLDVDTRYRLIEDLLVSGAIIDTKKGKIFNELRQLRNKVAHARGFAVGSAEAVQYIDLCFRLIRHFDDLTASSAVAAPGAALTAGA